MEQFRSLFTCIPFAWKTHILKKKKKERKQDTEWDFSFSHSKWKMYSSDCAALGGKCNSSFTTTTCNLGNHSFQGCLCSDSNKIHFGFAHRHCCKMLPQVWKLFTEEERLQPPRTWRPPKELESWGGRTWPNIRNLLPMISTYTFMLASLHLYRPT